MSQTASASATFGRRGALRAAGTAAVALAAARAQAPAPTPAPADPARARDRTLAELDAGQALAAMRAGTASAEGCAAALLRRVEAPSDLNACILVERDRALEAAPCPPWPACRRR